jgi:hypothetical protein
MTAQFRQILRRIFAVILLTAFAIALILITTNANTAAIAHDPTRSQSFSISFTYTVFLPLIASYKSCDVSGDATQYGQPVSNTLFGLSYSTWEGSHFTIYTTTTTEDGRFCFSSVPLLPACRGFWYSVYFGYGLSVLQEDFAAGWATSLVRCEATQVFTDIHAELSDITVLTPLDNVTVTLPVTFSWIHSAVENGYYSLQFADCWPTITAGYSATLTFASLPQCVTAGIPITWHLEENAGGIRKSRTHTVTFQLAK